MAPIGSHERRDGGDADNAGLLARDDTLRRGVRCTFAVDLLNRSLLSGILAPLRRALMREGVQPASQLRLMRGEAL